MSILDAILLGFVQGVTSFLPVSSSGHVILLEQLLKIKIHNTAFLSAMLNLGTLGAMLIVFQQDIRKLVKAIGAIACDLYKNLMIFVNNTRRNQDNAYIKLLNTNYKKFAGLILISIIPTALVGCLLKAVLSEEITLMVVGLNLLVSGILLLVVDFVTPGWKQPKEASLLSGAVCGLCQGAAVVPGISRYGMTLSAGILFGYSKKFAVKYSFIMSIPAIIGALILEIRNAITDPLINLEFVLYSIAGAGVACLVGLFCIKIMMNLIQKKRLKIFSFYCFIIGIIAIAGNFLL